MTIHRPEPGWMALPADPERQWGDMEMGQEGKARVSFRVKGVEGHRVLLSLTDVDLTIGNRADKRLRELEEMGTKFRPGDDREHEEEENAFL